MPWPVAQDSNSSAYEATLSHPVSPNHGAAAHGRVGLIHCKMEAASLPLAAPRSLSPPATAPSCSRPKNLPFVRAAPQTLEARAAPKTQRPSPRRNAVADVKAAADPVAALTRYAPPLLYCSSTLVSPKHSFPVVVVIPRSKAQLLWPVNYATCVQ